MATSRRSIERLNGQMELVFSTDAILAYRPTLCGKGIQLFSVTVYLSMELCPKPSCTSYVTPVDDLVRRSQLYQTECLR